MQRSTVGSHGVTFRTYYQFSDKFALILIRHFIALPNFHRLHCTGEEHGCRQERSRQELPCPCARAGARVKQVRECLPESRR
jgi:hypothetical protein